MQFNIVWGLYMPMKRGNFFLFFLFTAGHSDTSDLARCHKKVLKHDVNEPKHRSVFILFVFVLDYDELCSFFKEVVIINLCLSPDGFMWD